MNCVIGRCSKQGRQVYQPPGRAALGIAICDQHWERYWRTFYEWGWRRFDPPPRRTESGPKEEA